MGLIKTPEEIAKIEMAGKILKKAIDILRAETKEGVTLTALDRLARKIIEENGGEPAFLNYRPEGAVRPFPATICASPNDVVVHGVPIARKIKSGDLISIDCGVRYQGYYADAAFTVGVGRISPESRKLITVTREALELGIAAARVGNTVGHIGSAIGMHIRKNGFKVIRGLTGHGVGTMLHEEPTIYNEGERGTGMKLQAGMTIAIEPMVAIGTSRVEQLHDDSYATADGSLSAHFEKTIVITAKGPRILT